MSEKINLLDQALAIGDLAPVEVALGTINLTLRRTHTGADIAEWQKLEMKRARDVKAVWQDSDNAGQVYSEERRLELINSVGEEFIREYLKWITVDTSDEDVEAAAVLILALPPQAASSVLQQIGMTAGILTEAGEVAPFGKPSPTTVPSTTS